MTESERFTNALDQIATCSVATKQAKAELDPKVRQRMRVQIARGLRKAAAFLDDNGRLRA